MKSNTFTKSVFSCVLDYSPDMALQSYIWLNSLLEHQIHASQIYIHLVSEVPNAFLEYLNEIEINVIHKNTFDNRNKYCNKLTQLETFIGLKDYDYVFLMDCDTAVIDLENVDLTEEVYAKIVDFPNPPLPILQRIFDENKLQLLPVETTLPVKGEQVTDWNNCNGGLYIIKKDFLKTFAPKWIHYAKVCIEQESLFTPKYSKHADQVGFALALTSLNKKVTHLGIEWNYPTHVKTGVNIQPRILHFHGEVKSDLTLKKVDLTLVDKAITTINLIIKKMVKKDVKNTEFMLTVLNSKIINQIIKHQRDIGVSNLKKAVGEVDRPDLLQRIVEVSRQNLGFYTAHYPRVFEYTWIVEQLEDQKEINVLDIGAGVCPVPLYLNDIGFNVTTVDLHPTERKLKDKANWNEWGYLDYSVFDKSIISKHQDFTKVRSLKKFDCIYSISVIEHMPTAIRIKMLKRASKLLRKGGELLLTIDIVPDTNDIWNYSEGKQVESQEVHGTMSSFKKEIIAAGFKIIAEHIQRDIFESRTDVWYVKAILERKSFL